MRVAFDFDKMNFSEFMWYHDRLKKEKEEESNGSTGSNNMLDHVESMQRMGM